MSIRKKKSALAITTVLFLAALVAGGFIVYYLVRNSHPKVFSGVLAGVFVLTVFLVATRNKDAHDAEHRYWEED